MVDKITKVLNKLSQQEKTWIKQILLDIQARQSSKYDLRKLKGHRDIFRIRKGKIRIIYRFNKNKEVFLLAIERRTDKTYNL